MMTSTPEPTRPALFNRWRILGWGFAAALLALPAIAMRFTTEVNWGPEDFITIGIMLASVGLALELFVWMNGSAAYRLGGGLALIGLFLLIWVNLAVGIIGNEHDDANLMFAALPAIGILGAFLVRMRASGLARVLFGMAGVQLAIGAVALIGRLGEGAPKWPNDVIVLTGFFTALWLVCAVLFRTAGRAVR